MSDKKYEIRNMTEDEVNNIAVAWAAREGWNPGLRDAECFYAADPNGFFVGTLDGEPISCFSAVVYDTNFAFLGFYIVAPEYRGRGYGYEIWKAAMNYAGDRNIALDGVVEQQFNYKKSGFKLAYRNVRREGIAERIDEEFPEIAPISEASFEDILRFDEKRFPAERSKFLELWTSRPESATFAAVNDRKIAGYGTIRKCGVGYKIGPLFAENAELAEKLFLTMRNFAEPGEKFYLDTPEVNEAAVALADEYDMATVFETARMYTGPEPDIDVNEVFGVTSFELG